MAERNRPHLIVTTEASAEPYRRPPRRIEGTEKPGPTDRKAHAQALRGALKQAETEALANREPHAIEIEGSIPGFYVTFESFPGLDLALESLDPSRGKHHPELRSVTQRIIDGDLLDYATVFVPDGTLGYFLKRIDRYEQTADTGTPKNKKLLDRIQSIGLASITQLWTDPPDEYPAEGESVWWEVWLRRRDGDEATRFRAFAAQQDGMEAGPRTLAFADRLVVLAFATPERLATSLDVLDDIAELRKPRQSAEFLALAPAADQADWVTQLAERIAPAPENAPAACVVDTGVDRGHSLLAESLDASDCHSCDPAWTVYDHHGHGTEMAGLALFGDLAEVLNSTGPIPLRHRLESVKLLPPHGQNQAELWGAITATGASLAEIQAPGRQRAFCLAVTSNGVRADGTRNLVTGQPSSWSAAVDALAAGLTVVNDAQDQVFLDDDDPTQERLFLVAAGNVDHIGDDYLDRCDVEPVEDPAQAWNALTVGAYTELVELDPGEQGYDGYTPLAAHGDLSPHSRTSVACSPRWPAKPDVLFEGGNVARSPDGHVFDTPYSFQRLTTKRLTPDPRPLTVTAQTSAATAQAAHLAASVMAEYPTIWPETVRALIVHSAEWTPAMKTQLDAATQRHARDGLRRRYGMGVPSLSRATRSATDALTLIAEETIHPFDGEGRMREMHLHSLPWPTEVLEDLGETEVRLRVTLSYFIQPNPGSRGWVRRYSYASHGLRFDVRRATEDNTAFRKRLNQLALAEEEKRPTPVASDASEWYLGPDYRVLGSLHSDIWTGTAADLAERGAVAIYPVTGWWKLLPDRDRSERGARYSLVVSIETPDQDVDIWTPVAEQIGIPIAIES